MRRFYNFSNSVINIFWRVLFFLTLFFALTSVNIIIGDNDTFGTSTTMVTTGLVIFIIAIIVMNYAYPKIRAWFYNVFIIHQVLTGSLIILAVVAAQIFFVMYCHPVSGFDSGMLLHAATSTKHAQEVDVTSYFSLNQNNLPIMLFMHWLVTLSGKTSWLFFDYVTLFSVDLSMVINLLSIMLIKKRLLGTALYMHSAWLMVFPTIIMPYTDAWSLPLVSMYLFCYFVMYKTAKMDTVIEQISFMLAGVVFGFSVVLVYFVKPSAIIPVIAIVIIGILNWLIKKKHLTIRGLVVTFAALTLIGAGAGATYKIANDKIQNQTYIEIDKTRSIPAIHFMAMGVYGQGGYDWHQAVAMTFIPTEKQKSDYSVMMLKKRLKKLGAFGYFKFLIMKQRNNTADGTFGWLKEGHFFLDNQKPSNKGITNKLKNYIYLYGRHIADFRFAAQLWWITLLVIIALGFGPRNNLIQILRLSLVGGFIFLLLFEGGRSRYLIQYLPCVLLLGVLSFERAVSNIKRLFGWYEFKVNEAEKSDELSRNS
ncbi:TIGR03766 family XrtG-associated glycosyltransferase [Companilactobacillus keshanensis]|uniref:TIGR03766 family XrtG-associated glycosyltransferase n=1 Tax=Companilactobacillus keshanensis TaxID=2486003 RepID=A0ABW4BS50_9LACO|nr:TIGR03766 family XrtG-associated glycosyltransferase [Companilactobacillus keshanensis]